MSTGGGPAVTSLTFDSTKCQAIATVDPGPNGRTEWVKLWLLNGAQRELVGPMVLDGTTAEGEQIWIYQFTGGIPGGTYEAEAEICTVHIVTKQSSTTDLTCQQ